MATINRKKKRRRKKDYQLAWAFQIYLSISYFSPLKNVPFFTSEGPRRKEKTFQTLKNRKTKSREGNFDPFPTFQVPKDYF